MFEDHESRCSMVSRTLLETALRASPRTDDHVAVADRLVKETVTLLHVAPALSLRAARLLALLSAADLAPLGYSKFSDLCAEHVEWGHTWVRGLVRLVRSPLDQIKAAVNRGDVPIKLAAEAARTVSPEEQADWIAWVAAGGRPGALRAVRPERAGIEVQGDDARLIHLARGRARLHIGREVSDEAADDHVLHAWREKTPARQLLADSLADPPAPDTAPPPPWPDLQDPATAVVGPWREPADVHEALAELQRVQTVMRVRGVSIGLAMRRITDDELYRDLGYKSLRALVADRFPVGIRALEKYRRLGDDLTLFPELRQAFDEGMDLGRITAIARIATEDDAGRWLALSHHTSRRELERAVRLACQSVSSDVLDAYEAAVVELDAEGHWHANDGVALRAAWMPEPAPRFLEVDADLPEAAAWFLENAPIPKQYGIGKVKERDRYTCQNPECLRRGLRAQAHHIEWVSRGGSDDPDNLITVCKPCHLRLIHAGHVGVERVGKWILWTFPGRRVWVG